MIITSRATSGHTTDEVCASEPRASSLPPPFPVIREMHCLCQHILTSGCHWRALWWETFNSYAQDRCISNCALCQDFLAKQYSGSSSCIYENLVCVRERVSFPEITTSWVIRTISNQAHIYDLLYLLAVIPKTGANRKYKSAKQTLVQHKRLSPMDV